MCHNSSELSNHILKHSSKESFCFVEETYKIIVLQIFFKQKNIDLNELVVYMNKSNSKSLKKNLKQLCFFSPSGIKVFLKKIVLEIQFVFALVQTIS